MKAIIGSITLIAMKIKIFNTAETARKSSELGLFPLTALTVRRTASTSSMAVTFTVTNAS